MSAEISNDLEAEIQQVAQSDITKDKTPVEMLLGLFSSSEDATLMDEVVKIAYEGRTIASTRDIGLS